MTNNCLKCRSEIANDRLYCDECLFKIPKKILIVEEDQSLPTSSIGLI